MVGRVRKTILSAPDSPGVYIFKRKGRPIYIGKAKSLSNRLKAYLRPENERIKSMVDEADEIEIVPTSTESGALMLEANLIRRYKPKYNIRLKDGNPFLYIHLSDGIYPRLEVVRNPKEGGENYGPFLSRKALKDFLRFARKVFPVRNCSLRFPLRKKVRPCVEYHIGRCLAPCAYDVEREYEEAVEGFRRLLEGKNEDVIRYVYDKMIEEAGRYNYEAAAAWRDRLRALQEVVGKGGKIKHLWVIRSYGEDAVLVLYVLKDGKVLDVYSFHVSLSVEGEEGSLREFLSLFYAKSTEEPDEIITQPHVQVLGLRVRSPNKEDEEMVAMAMEYAHSKLESLLMSKNKTSPALESLKELLRLPSPPMRIEGYDISHTFGEFRVASLVVFKGGRPSRSDYRRFKIKSFEGIDDYAAMYEVVKRRFTKSDELPDLVLIDGGIGQLRAALKAMEEVGVSVPAVALAKEYETLHLTTGEVIQLPMRDPALRLLMRVRDEAHRFALRYHRTLRSKRYSKSVLDEIPGIGKKRKSILLSHFGSVDRIKQASLSEIAELPTFNITLAKRVKDYLKNFA